jgi:HSP20 family protein
MREVGSGRIGPEAGHEDRRRTYATAWVPSTDVVARGRDLVIRVSLSGVSPEDVEITLSSDVLTVSGERRGDPDDQDETFYVRERYYGAFRRTWTLPAGVNEDDISADFENGLMEITVRGAAAPEPPRRSEIRNRSG